MKPSERVAIIDFGSQYTQLIARRIREQHVYCEVMPAWVEPERVRDLGPRALILSGGPASVMRDDAPPFDEALLDLGVPTLGICYGMQLLVLHFGGLVETASEQEYGRAELAVSIQDPLFEGVPAKSVVWMSHGDRVVRLPRGFEVLGTSSNSPFAAVRDRERSIYGLQFHPEVAHTEAGSRILQNFLRQIAGLAGTWSMEEFIDSQISELRARIGGASVICGVSGGVDSTVVAVLLRRAIGDQLHCFSVDNGLLRTGEIEEVRHIFERQLEIPLKVIDESELFLRRLRGIEDPEKKRVVIGHTFIEAFERAAARIRLKSTLAG